MREIIVLFLICSVCGGLFAAWLWLEWCEWSC